MNKTLRMRVASEYVKLREKMERKKALLQIWKKWEVPRSTLLRYVAEYRMN